MDYLSRDLNAVPPAWPHLSTVVDPPVIKDVATSVRKQPARGDLWACLL